MLFFNVAAAHTGRSCIRHKGRRQIGAYGRANVQAVLVPSLAEMGSLSVPHLFTTGYKYCSKQRILYDDSRMFEEPAAIRDEHNCIITVARSDETIAIRDEHDSEFLNLLDPFMLLSFHHEVAAISDASVNNLPQKHARVKTVQSVIQPQI